MTSESTAAATIKPTAIKFCGLTSLDDAELCIGHGAWALGMIFWPGSPRAIERIEAVRIGAACKRRVELAGVFVNAAMDEVVRVVDEVGLTLIQLHGDEGPVYAEEVGRRTGARVIKVARVEGQWNVRALGSFPGVAYHLLDTKVDNVPGGSGQSFDWKLALGHRGGVPMILAGGLTPENVGEAVRTVRPFAVDVAGGTEASPGVKDPARVAAFAAAVAEAQPEPEPEPEPKPEEATA